jgi:HAD superfamily hydrolase (TIGR01490 family)
MTQELRPRGRVAAFFDLDGTLVPKPSLEWRLFVALRRRGAIPLRNYGLWLAQVAKLAPRGLSSVRHANKMFLRGVRTLHENGELQGISQGADIRIPQFFPEALDRIAWHAKQGHAIVIVSGTLEVLARSAARVLRAQLFSGEIETSIQVLATRLEETEKLWTGRVLGEGMFGESKARAVRRLADADGYDLPRCYAYGDSLADRWLLAATGRPTAINPSRDLLSMARKRGWPVLRWREQISVPQLVESPL